jgi:hypothetical protein
VRPGREHDTTALREHAEILPLLTAWTDDDLRVLGDLYWASGALHRGVVRRKDTRGVIYGPKSEGVKLPT